MRPGTLLVVGALTVAFAACSEPTIPNYNSPTVEAAAKILRSEFGSRT